MKRRREPSGEAPDVILGVVAIAAPGQVDAATRYLRSLAGVEIGEPNSVRIPFVAETRLGEDEALVEHIRSHSSITHIDVTYAHVMEGGETCQSTGENS